MATDMRPKVSLVGKELQESLIPLYADYMDHLSRWQGGTLEHQWHDYVCDAHALLLRLSERMNAEEIAFRLITNMADMAGTYHAAHHF